MSNERKRCRAAILRARIVAGNMIARATHSSPGECVVKERQNVVILAIARYEDEGATQARSAHTVQSARAKMSFGRENGVFTTEESHRAVG